MLKNIIVFAIAAAFGSVAYAQAPATTSAKPVEAVNSAAAPIAAKPEMKAETKPATKVEEKKPAKEAVKTEKKYNLSNNNQV